MREPQMTGVIHGVVEGRSAGQATGYLQPVVEWSQLRGPLSSSVVRPMGPTIEATSRVEKCEDHHSSEGYG